MIVAWMLPLVAFMVLVVLERLNATRVVAATHYGRGDALLNLAGLAVQGALVPLAGYWIATQVLATRWPSAAGTLQIGWFGAFLLNFVLVDFLYYWQHRLFHRVPWLWALHLCHHASPAISVWATSRNSLIINFLFVYMLVNPLLGFLCDRPEGFFAAAALTASLDLWRHSRLPIRHSPPLLVSPAQHHAHHGIDGHGVNYGANLIVWDRWFGTEYRADAYPRSYGAAGAPGHWRQFLFPW